MPADGSQPSAKLLRADGGQGGATSRVQREITIDGKDVAEVRKHLFTPFGERFTIGVHGGGDMQIDAEHDH